MTSKPALAGRFSLRRWSQRKLEVARAEAQASTQAPPPAAAASAPLADGAAQDALQPSNPAHSAETALPPIESLTFESDFAPFFKPEVDESLKRAALKQLFRHPRFNVMDGLDTYIDDYTQPDPIPPAMLADLMERRVSFAVAEAETDSGRRGVDEPAADHIASSDDAVARPDAQIESVEAGAPVAPAGATPDKAQGTADSMPETGADAKAGKP
jgi:Protein of unknown function (DUF3306)